MIILPSIVQDNMERQLRFEEIFQGKGERFLEEEGRRRGQMETTDSSGERLSIKRRTAVKRLQEQCETLMEERKNYDGDASFTVGGRSAVRNACPAPWGCMIGF